MRPALTLSVLALSGVATIAVGQANDPIAAAVAARQAHMTLFASNLGVLGGMARGNAEYDADAAQAAADNLVALSGMSQMFYWPEGSSSEEVEDSRALPAIWEEGLDEFTSHIDELHEAAMAMADVAGDGLEAVQGQMGALGGECGECHEEYRVSDN